MLMNPRSAKEFPTVRTMRRVRDEGLWYDATPTRDSSRRTRSAGGVARACRIGVQSARRGEKQRRTMGSYPLTCRAQRGKNQSIGSRASNTLHQRKPAVKREREREREKTKQAIGQENVLYSHSYRHNQPNLSYGSKHYTALHNMLRDNTT